MSIIHIYLQFYRLNKFEGQGLRDLSLQIETVSSFFFYEDCVSLQYVSLLVFEERCVHVHH